MRQDDQGRALFEQKATAADFAAALSSHCNWFSGVADSVFQQVLPVLPDWHFAPRENHAVGMAFGARLGGRRPAILIQNSGLGLCLDALLGTFHLYGQGLLLVVSDRGVLPWEEVQHKEWGRVTRMLLAAVEIPQVSFDVEGMAGLERAAQWAEDERVIVSLIVNRGNIDE